MNKVLRYHLEYVSIISRVALCVCHPCVMRNKRGQVDRI